MNRHFESLDRAVRVFSGNSLELAQHVGHFVGTDKMPSELEDAYEHELVRLFHNYLASAMTLRDVQRAVHRTIWPTKGKNDKGQLILSDWEVKHWQPKVSEAYGSAQIKFLQELRNYTVHYDLPVPKQSTRISWSAGGPVVHENRLRLNKNKLLQWNGWTAQPRNFLNTQHDWMEFLPIIEKYSVAVREFYKWFWDTIAKELSPQYSDFNETMTEFSLWTAEQKAFRNWKISHHPRSDGHPEPSPTETRRELAMRRAKRWEHGSRGWRLFRVHPLTNMAEQIGEDPWGLPPRSNR